MHNQLPGSPNLPPIPNATGNARYESYPLSREGSVSSSGTPLQREPSSNTRTSRFSVVEKDSDGKDGNREDSRDTSQDRSRDRSRERNNGSFSGNEQMPSHQHTLSTESRKIGRFELTAGGPSSLDIKAGDGMLHRLETTRSF